MRSIGATALLRPTASTPLSDRRSSVERSSPHDACSSSRFRGKLVRTRRPTGQRDRQIDPDPSFFQARAGEVTVSGLQGKSSSAKRIPLTYPLPGLLAGTIGEADDRERRRASLQVRLHLHSPRLETDEGKGDPRARAHSDASRNSDTRLCRLSAAIQHVFEIFAGTFFLFGGSHDGTQTLRRGGKPCTFGVISGLKARGRRSGRSGSERLVARPDLALSSTSTIRSK